MKALQSAINEEQLYIANRMNNIDDSLLGRLKQCGYETVKEYFDEKREYFFKNWIPDVYYVDIKTLTSELENAVQNKKYGIYISTADGLYAFHGSNDIDYDLCRDLGVCVAEVYHKGGTIIGDKEDFGIEIVAPSYIGLDLQYILNNIYKILNKYIDNISIVGNDFIVDGEKIMGSMERSLGDTYVWAAQFSFGNHDDIIKKICKKKMIKKPGQINQNIISKDILEKEVVRWLQKR